MTPGPRLEPRAGVPGRRRRHAERARRLRRRRRAQAHLHLQRRGLWLPRRQPRVARRGRRRCAATRSSPTRITSAWSRRCSRAARAEHPELLQLVFRPDILGPRARTRSPRSSTGRFVLGLAGRDSPSSSSGTRTWSARSCAASATAAPVSSTSRATARSRCARWRRCSGSPTSPLPPARRRGARGRCKALGLTQLRPRAGRFLRYRPVLANEQAQVPDLRLYAPSCRARSASSALWRRATRLPSPDTSVSSRARPLAGVYSRRRRVSALTALESTPLSAEDLGFW